MNNRAQKFMISWISIIFLSYYFLKLLNIFQGTYNTWLQERYKDDFSTHLELNPDLWMKARSSSGLDRNWVYDIFGIMDEDMRTNCNVSTIGSLNQVRASNLWLSRWLCENNLKLIRLDFVLRWPNLGHWHWLKG